MDPDTAYTHIHMSRSITSLNVWISSFVAKNADVQLANQYVTGFFIGIVRMQVFVVEELNEVAAENTSLRNGTKCLKPFKSTWNAHEMISNQNVNH